MKILKEKALTFDDVLLKPRYSNISSRSSNQNCLKTQILPNILLKYPIISANMDTITGGKFAKKIETLGGLGIVHRFMNKEQHRIELIDNSLDPSIACIGVGNSGMERLAAIHDLCNTVLIDVAHGHSESVKQQIKNIKNKYPDKSIIAGNVATAEGALFLAEAKADCIKVGVGPGSLCSTRIQTGNGYPQLSAIINIKNALNVEDFSNVTIIADGGIKNSGDIIKALAAGADAVMIGSLFAGTEETPGGLFQQKSALYKSYRGMACYSSDTEILTKSGWKYFTDLKQTEKVATLNSAGSLEYNYPSKYYEYDHDGKMINFKGKFIDLQVTPNHKMWVAKRARINDRYSRKFKFVSAEDCYNEQWHFKRNCNWEGKPQNKFTINPNQEDSISVNMQNWLLWFGLWLAKGSTYTYTQKEKYTVYITDFSNNDPEVLKIFTDFLAQNKVNYTIQHKSSHPISREVKIYDRRFYQYLQHFGKASDKFIPNEIKNLSAKDLRILLHGLWLGDRCKSKKVIYTASTQLRDDVMEIGLKAGYSVQYSISHKKGSEGVINGINFTRNHDVWAISYHNYSDEPLLAKENITKEHYKGKVYCLEVPNHLVMVRRNGKTAWCGNSREAQINWKQTAKFIEGETKTVPFKGKLQFVFEDLIYGMLSGMSYQGAKSLQQLRKNATFIQQTSAGYHESNPHGLY